MDWSIVGIVVTLGLAIVVWVRRKYFTQPELTMELKSDGGHSLPRGMSNHQGVPDEIAGTANNLCLELASSREASPPRPTITRL